ncbi:MAG: hypothetical protein A3E77_18095 [Sphingopyxis sp. RIFCSPHIGHO2_12_FULL_65_19]|nr:MAG: hypothetical protein A3E77_18095 [Sphingopyxis sp. RIFCSPHIGHO2_12_FULL_65_19]
MQNQTFHQGLDGDLASEATIFVRPFRKLQEVCLRSAFGQAADLVDPGRIHKHMAGCTSAHPAAITVDARHIVEQRRFARCLTFGYVDCPPRSIAGNERHFDHIKLRFF